MLIYPNHKSKDEQSEDTVLKTAGKQRKKAITIWKRIARKDEEVKLLKSLKDIGLGTRKIEDFLRDIRGDSKRGGGSQSVGGHKTQTKNNKIQKKYKKQKIQKSKDEMMIVKKLMNDKIYDAVKDLKRQMKIQDRMKKMLEEEIRDKKKITKIMKNLRRIRRIEAGIIQRKNRKKIEFMMKKYGKKEEKENEEVMEILRKYKMTKYLDEDYKPTEEVQDYQILIIETGQDSMKI